MGCQCNPHHPYIGWCDAPGKKQKAISDKLMLTFMNWQQKIAKKESLQTL
jgi:hypothetical protein